RLSDRAYDRQPIGNDRRGFFVRFGVSKQNYDATPLDLVLGHLGDEAAPAGVVDQGRCAPRCLLLVGLSLAGAA
ncbi:hypothetical protein, partial [Aeromonas caviae]|uniref:hypothetical protein n=1 Tax=Aeromonas caviae TaxID=648 RepID=UPI004039D9BB